MTTIALTSLQYSRQIPTQPGWYWIREHERKDLIFCLQVWDFPLLPNFTKGRQFAGPIPLPRDAEPEGCAP